MKSTQTLKGLKSQTDHESIIHGITSFHQQTLDEKLSPHTSVMGCLQSAHIINAAANLISRK